jgi:hypothetical protein
MTHDPAFDDPWLKWLWATENSHALDAELKRALQHELDSPSTLPFTTAQEYHPEFHGFSVFIDSVRPTPDWWGLWLGDVIHAYRSSLDHLAWILVDRGSTPTATLTDTERRKIYFPCAWDRGWFNSAIKRKLPGCRRADIARVRAAQPYKAGKRRISTHPLTILDTLSNSEKHRTIQPVRRHQETGFYDVSTAVDCIVRRVKVLPSVELHVGTEIARVYARRTGPNPDIEMKGYMAGTVGVQHGKPVQDFLNETRRYVGGLLAKFSDPPPDLFIRARVPAGGIQDARHEAPS